ncbi:Uncharacterised protein [Vibrio cholerae]|nr:Uncharacterised protein [Vibrio cholerae]
MVLHRQTLSTQTAQPCDLTKAYLIEWLNPRFDC